MREQRKLVRGAPDATADRSTGAKRPNGRNDIEILERQLLALMDSFRQKQRQRATDFDEAVQPAGYRTLVELVHHGPIGATQLAEVLGFDKSTLSRQLHQLEELGHISRCSNPEDGRAVIVSATPSAQDRIAELHEDHRDAFRARLGTWNVYDVRELGRLLGELSKA